MQVGTSPLLLWYALYQCQEGEKVKFFQGGKVGTLGKQSTKKCVNKEIVLIYLDPLLYPSPIDFCDQFVGYCFTSDK